MSVLENANTLNSLRLRRDTGVAQPQPVTLGGDGVISEDTGSLAKDLLILDSVSGEIGNGSALSFINNTTANLHLVMGRIRTSRVDSATVRMDLEVSDGSFSIGDETFPALSLVGASQQRVGIGTRTPTARLDVAGSVHASGDTALEGALTVGGPTTLASLAVSGDIKAASFSGDGSRLTNIPQADSLWKALGSDIAYSTGKVGIGTLTPAHTLDIQGTLRVSGKVSASAFSGDGSGLSNLPSQWAQSDRNLSYSAGNVAVGTAVAYTTLTIEGSIGFTNGVTPMLFLYQNSGSGQDRSILAHSPTRAGTGLAYRSANDTFLFLHQNTPTLTVQLATQRIGVGLAEPRAALHVSGGQGDLSRSEGDVVIGSTQHRLKIGVYTQGGRAGEVVLRAQGGSEWLRLGSGNNDVLNIRGSEVWLGAESKPLRMTSAGELQAQKAVIAGELSAGTVTVANELRAQQISVTGAFKAGTLTSTGRIAGGGSGPAWWLESDQTWGGNSQRFVALRTQGLGLNNAVLLDLAVSGVIINGNRFDLAEMTPAHPKERLELGDVVVIDSEVGMRVRRSNRPFDSAVYGIVSSLAQAALLIGPHDLAEQEAAASMVPVALAGRVAAKASAENGPIRPGDLLTTARTPGHLMRCEDVVNHQGAIVAKALEPLKRGQGQITVLVTMV